MQSLLVKIASVAVMFHMTFGCSMHHGLGTTACAHQHETACDHDADSTGHDEDDDHHDQLPNSEPASDVDEKSPSHASCSDDGCNATQFVAFKFQALDFSVPYLGGADTLALIENKSDAGFDAISIPDGLHWETGVRAHLLLGVQIL